MDLTGLRASRSCSLSFLPSLGKRPCQALTFASRSFCSFSRSVFCSGVALLSADFCFFRSSSSAYSAGTSCLAFFCSVLFRSKALKPAAKSQASLTAPLPLNLGLCQHLPSFLLATILQCPPRHVGLFDIAAAAIKLPKFQQGPVAMRRCDIFHTLSLLQRSAHGIRTWAVRQDFELGEDVGLGRGFLDSFRHQAVLSEPVLQLSC